MFQLPMISLVISCYFHNVISIALSVLQTGVCLKHDGNPETEKDVFPRFAAGFPTTSLHFMMFHCIEISNRALFYRRFVIFCF